MNDWFTLSESGVPSLRQESWLSCVHGRSFHRTYGWFTEGFDTPALKEYYSRSGNAEKAVNYLQLAGQQAIQRSAHGEAITHFNAALDLLKTLPESAQRVQRELGLQIALGTALTPIKGAAAPEVETAYTRARQLAHKGLETAELFPALFGLFLVSFLRGNREAAKELAEQQFNLAQRVNDPILVAIAHYALANNLSNDGEFVPACQHFEQSLTLYETHGRPFVTSLMGEELGVVCRIYLALAPWCAASIIFAGRVNYFCRLAPRLIESVRLRFIV